MDSTSLSLFFCRQGAPGRPGGRGATGEKGSAVSLIVILNKGTKLVQLMMADTILHYHTILSLVGYQDGQYILCNIDYNQNHIRLADLTCKIYFCSFVLRIPGNSKKF